MTSALGPGWALAGVMVTITGHHLTHVARSLRSGRRAALDIDLTHAAMGVVMAIMLVGSLTSRAAAGWAIGFTVATGWFAGRTLRSYFRDSPRSVAPPLAQTLTGVAMVYMLAGTATAGGSASGAEAAGMDLGGMNMTGMAPDGGTPSFTAGWLTIVVIAASIGVVIWTAGRLRPAVATAGSGPGAVAASCQLAMSVTTVYMLVLMV